MPTARHLIATLAASATFVAIAAAPASAQSPLSYKIRAVHPTANGGAPKEIIVPATMAVPALVDVDGFLPDLAVELIPAGTSGLILEVVALRPLPVLVEAVVPLPNTSRSVALGYDARESRAPLLAHQSAVTSGADISYDFGFVGATKGIAVLGSLFEGGPGETERRDPIAAALAFPDVAPLSGRASSKQAGAVQTIQASATPSVRGIVKAGKTVGTDVKSVTADISALPTQTTVELERDGAGEVSRVGYRASSVVAKVDLTAEQRVDGKLATQAVAHLQQVPPEATLTRSGSRIEFTAPVITPGWVAEAGLAKGGPVTLDTRDAYVKAVDVAGTRSLAFKAAGVQRAIVDTSNPLKVELLHEPKPLHASIQKDTLSLEGDVTTPPRQLSISFDKTTKAGTIDAFGQPVGDVKLTATDEAGLAGRATHLLLDADGVPPFLRFGFRDTTPQATTRRFEEEITEDIPGEGGGGGTPLPVEDAPPVQPPVTKEFSVQAFTSAEAAQPIAGQPAPKPDAKIKDVVFQLGSEADPESTVDQALLDDAGSAGFLLEDTLDQFLAFGRIDGLKAVTVKTVRDSRRKRAVVNVDADTLKKVRVGFVRQQGQLQPEITTASLDTLPTGLSLDFSTLVQDILNTETELHYSADETGGPLTFTTNAGRRKSLKATLTPLPKTLDLCIDGYGSCLRPVLDRIAKVDPGPATFGTAITFDAASSTQLDLFDCVKARAGVTVCDSEDDAENSIDVNVRNAEHLELGEDIDLEADEEWIWVDTDDQTLSGGARLFKRGISPNIGIQMPGAFRARGRLLGLDLFPPRQVHRAVGGTVTCGAGFDIDLVAVVVGEVAKNLFCNDNADSKGV